MKPVNLWGLTLLLSSLPSLAQGSIVDDSTTFFSHSAGEFTFRSNNLLDEYFSRLEPPSPAFFDAYASVERGVIRMHTNSKSGSSFPRLSASVRDFYVLSGNAIDVDASMDGIQVNLPVTLTLEGTASETQMYGINRVQGRLFAALSIGRDLNLTSHGVLNGNPVIQNVGGIASRGEEVLSYRRARSTLTCPLPLISK